MNGSQTVTFVSGDVDANGQSIQLRVEVDAAPNPINLRLQTGDLVHLVSLLLLLGTKVPQQSLRYGTSETLEALPLPLREPVSEPRMTVSNCCCLMSGRPCSPSAFPRIKSGTSAGHL